MASPSFILTSISSCNIQNCILQMFYIILNSCDKKQHKRIQMFQFLDENHFLWKYSSPFILYGCSLPRDLLMLLPRFFPRVKIYAQTLLQNIKFEFRPQRHKLLNLLWQKFPQRVLCVAMRISINLFISGLCRTMQYLSACVCYFITQKSHNV